MPHCLNHKCMWVLWKLSRQGSTWKNMEGRSIILYLSFSICSGRQTLVQTSFTKGTIWVPHCVSNMNTHGSLKVTALCFALECTRLIRCYVDTCRWTWCTFARLLYWRKDSHPFLHCVSNLNTLGALKLPLLCIDHEYTRPFKVDLTVLRAWMHMTFKVDFAVLRS